MSTSNAERGPQVHQAPPGGGLGAAALGSGLLLDLADLITFGPIGLWTGGLLGAALGWLIAPRIGFAVRRWVPAALAGLYLMTPGTALLPLAGLLVGVRALAGGRSEKPLVDGSRPQGSAIEADYVARWEEDGERGSD